MKALLKCLISIRARWEAWLLKRAQAANARDQRALDRRLQRRTRIPHAPHPTTRALSSQYMDSLKR